MATAASSAAAAKWTWRAGAVVATYAATPWVWGAVFGGGLLLESEIAVVALASAGCAAAGANHAWFLQRWPTSRPFVWSLVLAIAGWLLTVALPAVAMLPLAFVLMPGDGLEAQLAPLRLAALPVAIAAAQPWLATGCVVVWGVGAWLLIACGSGARATRSP